jgi:hypothetical protein
MIENLIFPKLAKKVIFVGLYRVWQQVGQHLFSSTKLT